MFNKVATLALAYTLIGWIVISFVFGGTVIVFATVCYCGNHSISFWTAAAAFIASSVYQGVILGALHKIAQETTDEEEDE